MIVAITSHNNGGAKSAVASTLAVLRAQSGRRVLLLEADPTQDNPAWSCKRSLFGRRAAVPVRITAGRDLPEQLERSCRLFNDIVIDTDGSDSAESRSALIAARLVVVPLSPGQVDLASQYQLIARLNAARMFNPGLRVLFVACGAGAPLTVAEAASIRAYAAQVMAATLAGVVLHEDCTDDMLALYSEIFKA